MYAPYNNTMESHHYRQERLPFSVSSSAEDRAQSAYSFVSGTTQPTLSIDRNNDSAYGPPSISAMPTTNTMMMSTPSAAASAAVPSGHFTFDFDDSVAAAVAASFAPNRVVSSNNATPSTPPPQHAVPTQFQQQQPQQQQQRSISPPTSVITTTSIQYHTTRSSGGGGLGGGSIRSNSGGGAFPTTTPALRTASGGLLSTSGGLLSTSGGAAHPQQQVNSQSSSNQRPTAANAPAAATVRSQSGPVFTADGKASMPAAVSEDEGHFRDTDTTVSIDSVGVAQIEKLMNRAAAYSVGGGHHRHADGTVDDLVYTTSDRVRHRVPSASVMSAQQQQQQQNHPYQQQRLATVAASMSPVPRGNSSNSAAVAAPNNGSAVSAVGSTLSYGTVATTIMTAQSQSAVPFSQTPEGYVLAESVLERKRQKERQEREERDMRLREKLLKNIPSSAVVASLAGEPHQSLPAASHNNYYPPSESAGSASSPPRAAGTYLNTTARPLTISSSSMATPMNSAAAAPPRRLVATANASNDVKLMTAANDSNISIHHQPLTDFDGMPRRTEQFLASQQRSLQQQQQRAPAADERKGGSEVAGVVAAGENTALSDLNHSTHSNANATASSVAAVPKILTPPATPAVAVASAPPLPFRPHASPAVIVGTDGTVQPYTISQTASIADTSSSTNRHQQQQHAELPTNTNANSLTNTSNGTLTALRNENEWLRSRLRTVAANYEDALDKKELLLKQLTEDCKKLRRRLAKDCPTINGVTMAQLKHSNERLSAQLARLVEMRGVGGGGVTNGGGGEVGPSQKPLATSSFCSSTIAKNKANGDGIDVVQRADDGTHQLLIEQHRQAMATALQAKDDEIATLKGIIQQQSAQLQQVFAASATARQRSASPSAAAKTRGDGGGVVKDPTTNTNGGAHANSNAAEQMQLMVRTQPENEAKVIECEAAISTLMTEIETLDQRLREQIYRSDEDKVSLQRRLEAQQAQFNVERLECDRVVHALSAKLEELARENSALRRQQQLTMQQQQQTQGQ